MKQPEIMAMFQKIVQDPASVQAEDIHKVTQFTLSVYGVSDPSKGLLQGRFDGLTNQKVTSFRSLLPSPGAAIVQFRKAVHIVGHIWGKACQPELCPPDICDHLQGWQKVGDRIDHIWTVFPESPATRTYTNCVKRSAAVGKKKTSVKEYVRVVTLIYLACTLANAAKSASNDNFASHSNYYGTNHYGMIRCRHVEF